MASIQDSYNKVLDPINAKSYSGRSAIDSALIYSDPVGKAHQSAAQEEEEKKLQDEFNRQQQDLINKLQASYDSAVKPAAAPAPSATPSAAPAATPATPVATPAAPAAALSPAQQRDANARALDASQYVSSYNTGTGQITAGTVNKSVPVTTSNYKNPYIQASLRQGVSNLQRNMSILSPSSIAYAPNQKALTEYQKWILS